MTLVMLPRMRQAVVVTLELRPLLARLLDRLGGWIDPPEPFHDPDVDRFGVENAVLAIGDSFLEILAPTRPDTAAGRHVHRRGGDAGYMIMLQVADMTATRQRLADLDVRVVWQVELPDAVDLHLHPHDVPGALVAVDTMDPPGSWRWGGPAHVGRESPAAGGLVGLTVAVPDPAGAAARWAAVAGVASSPNSETILLADGGQRVDFVPTTPDRVGLIRIAFAVPGCTRPENLTVGDTTIEFRPETEIPT